VPIIPLYNSPSNPDAWHRVRSPGGYEWSHFDAQDSQSDRQLIVNFYDGDVFNPVYRERYARYRRRPTQNPPPLAREFPCVHFTIYENGRVFFNRQLAASEFVGSDDSPSLAMGKNRVEVAGDKLRLTLLDQSVSAEIIFRPVLAFRPQIKTIDADHHWVIANSLCDVDATMDLGGEKMNFRGKGHRDHQFGTSLPTQRSVHGRVLLEDAVCAFHISQSPILIEVDASGAGQAQISRCACDWHSPIPRTIQLDEVLSLSNPRVLDSSPPRAMYDAVWRGRKATALCAINRFRD